MKQRIMTAAVAGAAFLALLGAGGYVYHVLIWIMALIGYHELARMSGIEKTGYAAAGYAGVAALALPWPDGEFPFGIGALTWIWFLMLLLMSGMVLSKNRMPIGQASILFLGAVYIGIGFHYMALTRWEENGLFWSMLLFACIWITDGGAYFTGYAFGKRPLWPAISPKKTVEGAVGGLLLSVLAAVCFALWRPDLIGVAEAAALGFAVGVIGQLGDLIESAFKRAFGVKDSGAILPGHGGVLDRCDSWLIVFPFFQLVFAPFA